VIRELPLSDQQIAEIQDALAEQTHNDENVGSAKIFNDFDWPISGKTGTAQNDLDSSDKPHSWFAAYGGADGEATIASVVLVENIGEGVSYAAPATKLVYQWYSTSDLASGAEPSGGQSGSPPSTPESTPD
jgi:cell division protein FtsI/penicillin-binding protein 2